MVLHALLYVYGADIASADANLGFSKVSVLLHCPLAPHLCPTRSHLPVHVVSVNAGIHITLLGFDIQRCDTLGKISIRGIRGETICKD